MWPESSPAAVAKRPGKFTGRCIDGTTGGRSTESGRCRMARLLLIQHSAVQTVGHEFAGLRRLITIVRIRSWSPSRVPSRACFRTPSTCSFWCRYPPEVLSIRWRITMPRPPVAPERGKRVMPTGSSVRKATLADAPRLAQALASAFQDDPVIAWIFPDEQRRRAVLPAFMEFRLRKPAPACAVPTGRHLRHRPTAVPRNRRRVDHGTHAQLARPSRSPAGPG